MKINNSFLAVFILMIALSHVGMGSTGKYDEEARRQEALERDVKKSETVDAEKNPVKNFVSGVKQVTVDSTTGLIEETAKSTAEEPPILGTLEGIRKGSGKVLDNTVKGAVKVATLGYGSVESYEVEEPEHGSGDPQKIKFSF